MEYTTGSSWLGDSLVGSATRPVPPGTDMRHVFVDDRFETKPWYDLAAIKKECKLGVRNLRDALEATRR